MARDINSYRLYLFTLDGTLVRPKGGKKWTETVHDREWLPGRLEGPRSLLQLKARGKLTCITTNQGGAAWKIFSPEEMNEALNQLAIEACMELYFVCYHDTGERARESADTISALTAPDFYTAYDGKQYDRRMPMPGMILEAMDHYPDPAGDTKRSTVLIGSRLIDQKTAEFAGIDFIFSHKFFNE